MVDPPATAGGTDRFRQGWVLVVMLVKLSVIFYIILCIVIGIALTVAPWWPQGMLGFGDWGNNFFLLYAAQKTGIQALPAIVASGWVRGAVSGIGLLNLGIAIWEIFHFKHTVAALRYQTEPRYKPESDAAESANANLVRDIERPDNQQNNSERPGVRIPTSPH
jgi:hypothetical protein